ncbi:DNA polymerase I [Mycobacterium phage Myxus]|uniref:DNA polymerase I n=9 Tax=Fromanvirus TaxID=186764 RepID=A0A142K4V3_9CAUD|nr:DNA polymerase I [Mycobacterium phage Pioneer]YP_009301868.1 DNA polymerase I [Mycobacterium phage Catalina]YP_009636014.1 DNA polymerase [Mycobacterium phage PackMan]AMO43913.1 DNA polymerase I [Mycobacterium phage Myxus]AMS00845.1 DNA polymerase I [Mycobacterium phage Eidsmoe]AOQ29001.1 DNA polymerase I [Mycobacterium phage HortumSL17]AOT26163.1 DNA polymerase I [Mycobacterium phage Qobbit]AOY12063.1 DNA polymerase I [Mycobacterium phage Phaeder]AVI03754.1 DNA polymerase I [Mycobacteri
MIELQHEVGGNLVNIHVVEHREDLDGFHDFIRTHQRCLAVDTETTGVDIYSRDFALRLVQFGTRDEAWVLPVEEMGDQGVGEVKHALNAIDKIVMQNASFDLQVLDKAMGIKMETLWPKILDTQILAKLVDPRPFEAGGFGHSLEELIAEFISEELAQDVKGLMTKLAKEHKTTKAKIWSTIDLFHPEYLKYAGMDTIFTARVCSALARRVPDVSRPLVAYEHKISEICSYIDRRGFLLDVDYASGLSDQMRRDQEVWEAIAFTKYGVEKVNSTEEVAEALEVETGVKITGRTETGKRKVDKELLGQLIKDGNELAMIVEETKRLGKWNTTWVQKFLDTRDSEDRCHTFINPLQARTSRMSITGIPAQTLPASDWIIRRCFLAEPGHLIASVDYQTQELRVLAALSGDQTMIEAFRQNADLHQITADASQVVRKVGKMANFLTVYGGGAKTLAQQAHIDFPTAKRVLDGFAKTYPSVARLSKKLGTEASNKGYIVTPVGRRLPVDSSRSYSALNYMIQSSSRDVTCRALIRLHEAGFTPYLRLPIHDEIVASLPADKSGWGAKEIARIMKEEMGPVTIGTDPEVGKRSWGSLYGADF